MVRFQITEAHVVGVEEKYVGPPRLVRRFRHASSAAHACGLHPENAKPAPGTPIAWMKSRRGMHSPRHGLTSGGPPPSIYAFRRHVSTTWRPSRARRPGLGALLHLDSTVNRTPFPSPVDNVLLAFCHSVGLNPLFGHFQEIPLVHMQKRLRAARAGAGVYGRQVPPIHLADGEERCSSARGSRAPLSRINAEGEGGRLGYCPEGTRMSVHSEQTP